MDRHDVGALGQQRGHLGLPGQDHGLQRLDAEPGIHPVDDVPIEAADLLGLLVDDLLRRDLRDAQRDAVLAGAGQRIVAAILERRLDLVEELRLVGARRRRGERGGEPEGKGEALWQGH